jgi:tetratricopeptide (TPR) repeat protein
VVGTDVYPARPLLSGLKSVDVVAERRKRIESAGRDDFVVCFANLECLFRGEIWGVADDLEIADARFAFEAQRTYADVRMAVRRQDRAGFQAPLDDEKWFATEAYAETNGRVERPIASQFGPRRLIQTEARAHHDYGWLLIARERFDEGLAEVKRAQELDPLSPQANVDVGWACIRARRYDEAIAQSRRTMELEPNFAEAWGCLMRAYQYAGRFAEAIAEAQRIMTRSGASQEELAALHRGDAASGMRIVEQWMLDRTKKAAGRGYVSDYHLAAQYAALGEKEQAFKWLEKAYTDRDPMTALLNTDPAYDRLRSEPRFGDFLRRIRVATQAVRPQ